MASFRFATDNGLPPEVLLKSTKKPTRQIRSDCNEHHHRTDERCSGGKRETWWK